MGRMVQYCDYPATGFSTLLASNGKLVNEFGFVYTNAYRAQKPLNLMKDSCPFIFKPKTNVIKSDQTNMDYNHIDTDNENENANTQNGDKIMLNFGCTAENKHTEMKYRIQNERNIALNQENGWLAAIMTEEAENISLNDNSISLEKKYTGIYLSVFKCDGSFEYKRICFKRIKILDELKNVAKASHNDVTIDEILRMARVRFNGNSVYVFGWTKTVKIVYHYEITSGDSLDDGNRGSGVLKGLINALSGLIDSNKKQKKEKKQQENGKGKRKENEKAKTDDSEDNKHSKGGYELNQVGHYIDDYWNIVDVMDIDVIHFDQSSRKENLVAVLFGQWIGYYTITKPKLVQNGEYKYDLKWFHVCILLFGFFSFSLLCCGYLFLFDFNAYLIQQNQHQNTYF